MSLTSLSSNLTLTSDSLDLSKNHYLYNYIIRIPTRSIRSKKRESNSFRIQVDKNMTIKHGAKLPDFNTVGQGDIKSRLASFCSLETVAVSVLILL